MAISVSHEILPEIKEYPRTSTTVINAYVQPVVRAYITALAARLRALGDRGAVATDAVERRPGLGRVRRHSTGAHHRKRPGRRRGRRRGARGRLNEPRVITFDMGGTTAKAGLVENGEVLRTEAIEVGGGVMAGSRLLVGAGYLLKLPAIDLAEVGAGGGSICRLDAARRAEGRAGQRRRRSGPVCYGRGGTEPTITDCNLVLGYLDPGGAGRRRTEAGRRGRARADRAHACRTVAPFRGGSGISACCVWHRHR